jgi:hypothetical protein
MERSCDRAASTPAPEKIRRDHERILEGAFTTRPVPSARRLGHTGDRRGHMAGGSLAVWFDVIIHAQEVTPTQLLAERG